MALALTTGGDAPARAQGSPPAITEPEAQAIAVDAYVYFYSLISIDVTRRQATNVEPGKVMLFGPANMFANAPAFPRPTLGPSSVPTSTRCIRPRGWT